ncbi:MAG: N-acetylneuraminate synthase family protein [Leptospirales bacterium]|nr:N-acetylneuraminate synthase family protein [Leptospirales bacterium]
MLHNIFNKKIIFIAEIGLNHNGDLKLAEQMIIKAAEAGADAVKFQTFIPEKMISPYSSYLLGKGRENGNKEYKDYEIIDFFKKFCFTSDQWKTLKDMAERCNVEFFSAPFDNESVDLLEDLNVRLYKIASSELTNTPLLRKIASAKKPVILSTGMSKPEEIETAIENLKRYGSPEIVLLHCVSLYPTEKNEANLNRIVSLSEKFKVPVGLSDHTGDYETALIAAALGAVVFEKHFIIDNNHECPDKVVSITADQFKEMIDKVNHTIAIMGEGKIEYSGRETHTALGARRSLFADKNIKSGDILTEEDVTALRPGTGLSPEMIDDIVGKISKTDIDAGSILKQEYFE